MSKDRSIATDALEVLGTIIDGVNVGRDAIHLAVEPATAGETLAPGNNIRRDEDGLWVSCKREDRLAIADPFLADLVKKGQRFLAIIPPREITSLRHVWSHPAFPEDTSGPMPVSFSKAESEAWLHAFVKDADCPDYETTIAVALGDYSAGTREDYGDHDQWDADECLHFRGIDAHGEIPDEFWTHLENATGQKPPHKPKYFSCGC